MDALGSCFFIVLSYALYDVEAVDAKRCCDREALGYPDPEAGLVMHC